MKMIICGQKTEASDNKTINAVNPATGEVIDTFPDATREDVESCIDYANEVKVAWAEKSLHQRAQLLYKAADLFEENAQELMELMCRETGKSILNCRYEIYDTVNLFRSFIEAGKHLSSEAFADPMAQGVPGNIYFTVREPLGVVVCIAPFNYPLNTLVFKVIPALLMGNSVIIKAPSDASLIIIRFTEALLEAGVFAVQVITGQGSKIGEWLIDNDEINCVSFTGSTKVGITIAQLAAKHLQKTLLELGGNDALIIFEDADIDYAVKESISRLWNAGQTCIASKRYIVQNGIKEKFTNALVEALKNYPKGDVTDESTYMGTVISEKAAKAVEEQVKLTVQQGADIAFGGKREGAYYYPTVLTNVTTDMDTARDMEIFGPVFSIIGFDTEQEAIEIANQSVYGLSGGVISSDYRKALRVAYKLKTGMVAVNGSGQARGDYAPFGGYKKSGLGRESITESLKEFTQIKTIVFKNIK